MNPPTTDYALPEATRRPSLIPRRPAGPVHPAVVPRVESVDLAEPPHRLITIPLCTSSFGWRERLAVWRASGIAHREGDDRATGRFEARLAVATGAAGAVATNSGTMALRLTLHVLGVSAGDEVLLPMVAPSSVAAAVLSVGAVPVLVDVEPRAWSISPELVEQWLQASFTAGRLPAAVIAIDPYGQTCNYADLLSVCQRYDVPVIEDASDSLGASWEDRPAGAIGTVGIASFGNSKLVSTGGGGAMFSRDRSLVTRARALIGAAPHTDHTMATANSLGCRLNPILGPIGSARLARLNELVGDRRRVAQWYTTALSSLPGIDVVPDAPWGRSSRWLTLVTIDPERFGATSRQVEAALGRAGIAARRVWSPLPHLDALSSCAQVGGRVAAGVQERALCLPSGALDRRQVRRVVEVIRQCHRPPATIRPSL